MDGFCKCVGTCGDALRCRKEARERKRHGNSLDTCNDCRGLLGKVHKAPRKDRKAKRTKPTATTAFDVMPPPSRVCVEAAASSVDDSAPHVPPNMHTSLDRIADSLEHRVDVGDDLTEAIDNVVTDIQCARSVLIASYAFDNARIHAAFLGRLAARAERPLNLKILVDKGQAAKGSSTKMKTYLTELSEV